MLYRVSNLKPADFRQGDLASRLQDFDHIHGKIRNKGMRLSGEIFFRDDLILVFSGEVVFLAPGVLQSDEDGFYFATAKDKLRMKPSEDAAVPTRPDSFLPPEKITKEDFLKILDLYVQNWMHETHFW